MKIRSRCDFNADQSRAAQAMAQRDIDDFAAGLTRRKQEIPFGAGNSPGNRRWQGTPLAGGLSTRCTW